MKRPAPANPLADAGLFVFPPEQLIIYQEPGETQGEIRNFIYGLAEPPGIGKSNWMPTAGTELPCRAAGVRSLDSPIARGAVLALGTIFTAIDNTATTPIVGTFANLADGSTIIVGSNIFQADYEGGDGNDLALTVVP